jgi:hypothetical protein
MTGVSGLVDIQGKKKTFRAVTGITTPAKSCVPVKPGRKA